MISYRPFFETLMKSDLTMYDLMKHYKVAGSTLQKLRDNENMTLASIDRLCRIFHCEISDIVEIIET